jgi:large subunit ribosomal protein L6
MSKIGRRPIILAGLQVEVKGQEIHYKGKNKSGVYVLPDCLSVSTSDSKLTLGCDDVNGKGNKSLWGMHRALLANALMGAQNDFEKKIDIVGLGYKGQLSGDVITFSLGYSHKVTLQVPKGVSLNIDKTGQKLTFSSHDKAQLGHVCALVRSLRPPEPYKGTGIKLANEVIRRKAGKTKGSE